MMLELPLVLIGGLLGSAHCLGMCGGFALLIGAPAHSWSTNLGRQLVYSGGRIFSYASLGAVVGYGGLRLASGLGGIVNVQAAIAIVAGLLLVAQGLISTGMMAHLTRGVRGLLIRAGWMSPSELPGVGVGCLMGGIVGTFLRDRRWSHVFLAGVFTGLLPCGLVYAYLALAASTSDLLGGVATMAVFGLGTMPMMILAGTGSTLFSLAGRRRLLYLAAWCVVLTGCLSVARGVGFLDLTGAETTGSCPFCD